MNFDVDDDLDLSIDPSELLTEYTNTNIVPPTNTPQITPTVTLPVFNDNIVKNTIPQLKTQITLISDNGNKILDIREIEQVILGEGGIDTNTAMAVESLTGPTFSSKLPINSFTHAATFVNFNETINYIKDHVALESINNNNAASEVLNAISKLTNEHLELLAETSLPMLVYKIDDIIGDNNSNTSISVIDSPNMVIHSNNAFINLLNIPVDELIEVKISPDLKISPTVFSNASKKVIHELTDYPDLKDFIVERLFKANAVDVINLRGLTTIVFYKELMKELKTINTYILKEVIPLVATFTADGVSSFDYVCQHKDELLKLLSNISKTTIIATHLPHLLDALELLKSELKKLI